jgi:hypothetical protein
MQKLELCALALSPSCVLSSASETAASSFSRPTIVSRTSSDTSSAFASARKARDGSLSGKPRDARKERR